MSAQRYRMTIPSDVRHLDKVVNLAESVARQASLSRDDSEDLAISVSEAVNNAIVHGNKQDSSKHVDVEFLFDEHRVQVTVKDEGDGFQPHMVPDPLEPDNLRKESGRGIFIVRQLMDDVSYEFSGGQTIVRLVKHRRPDAGSSAGAPA